MNLLDRWSKGQVGGWSKHDAEPSSVVMSESFGQAVEGSNSEGGVSAMLNHHLWTGGLQQNESVPTLFSFYVLCCGSAVTDTFGWVVATSGVPSLLFLYCVADGQSVVIWLLFSFNVCI